MHKFDLENRTTEFGIKIVSYCKKVGVDPIMKPLAIQLVRSGTSIGANYREANGADSKKDFHAKVSICKKEAKETMHWLQIINASLNNNHAESKKLWQEAHELVLIFSAINRKAT